MQIQKEIKSLILNIHKSLTPEKYDELTKNIRIDKITDISFIVKKIREDEEGNNGSEYPYPYPKRRVKEEFDEYPKTGNIDIDRLFEILQRKAEEQGLAITQTQLEQVLKKPEWLSYKISDDKFNPGILSRLTELLHQTADIRFTDEDKEKLCKKLNIKTRVKNF